MPKFNEIKNIWKEVFGKFRYMFITILVTLLFYLFNAIIPNINLIHSFYLINGFFSAIQLIFNLAIGFVYIIKLHSFISLVIISFLFGILSSLFLYRYRLAKADIDKKVGVLTSIGVFFGIIAPGCAACSIGLLSVLGIGGAFLTFLPFDGLELPILSILILVFSVYKISDNLTKRNVCEIKNKRS